MRIGSTFLLPVSFHINSLFLLFFFAGSFYVAYDEYLRFGQFSWAAAAFGLLFLGAALFFMLYRVSFEEQSFKVGWIYRKRYNYQDFERFSTSYSSGHRGMGHGYVVLRKDGRKPLRFLCSHPIDIQDTLQKYWNKVDEPSRVKELCKDLLRDIKKHRIRLAAKIPESEIVRVSVILNSYIQKINDRKLLWYPRYGFRRRLSPDWLPFPEFERAFKLIEDSYRTLP